MLRSVVLPGDLPGLLVLEAALFPRFMWSERLLEAELGRGPGWVIGYVPVAYVLARVDGPIVDITRLGVTPAWQGRGFGAELLEKVIGLGKETMLTVEKANTRALKLYLRHGFRIAGALSCDAWVMRRPRQSARAEYSVPQLHR